VGAERGIAELQLSPFLVLGEVAVEERDLALVLEGEDVGRDAVEEPAVVGDADRATRSSTTPDVGPISTET
jgi:hypothetical protein